ncbi:MAG TPA: undecaprenyl-phosphate glucose phosphotransferase [Anaerolineae bacterium]|nr:undecaprenyl-phosphate glucose phosphotransferase [Anaerolineae bacterium]
MPRHYPHWITVALAISDAVLMIVAFLTAYYARIELQLFRAVDPSYQTPLPQYLPFVVGLIVLQLIMFRIGGAYDLRRNPTWLDMLTVIVRSALLSVVLLIIATFFNLAVLFSRLLFLYNAVLIIVYLSFSRAIWVAVLAQLRRRGIGVARTLIVGAGEVARTVLRTIIARPELGFHVVGFVDDHPERRATDIGSFRALGALDSISALLATHSIDEVIVTLPWSDHPRILRIVQLCEARGVRPRIVPDLFQMSLTSVDVDDLGGIPLIAMRTPSLSGVNLLVKRVLDLVVGLPLTALLLPLIALLALAIKLDSPGPVFFRQARVGLNGQLFCCFKFRSMRRGAEEELAQLRHRNEASGPLFKIKADPRRTRVGRILRRTSLDELPQLFNVLRGEMSLVGPRPPLPDEVDEYKDWHKQRLVARPGMTGLWQVSGRSDLSFEEGVLLDIYYIENWSLLLDIKTLLRTIPKMLSGNGAY